MGSCQVKTNFFSHQFVYFLLLSIEYSQCTNGLSKVIEVRKGFAGKALRRLPMLSSENAEFTHVIVGNTITMGLTRSLLWKSQLPHRITIALPFLTPTSKRISPGGLSVNWLTPGLLIPHIKFKEEVVQNSITKLGESWTLDFISIGNYLLRHRRVDWHAYTLHFLDRKTCQEPKTYRKKPNFIGQWFCFHKLPNIFQGKSNLNTKVIFQ